MTDDQTEAIGDAEAILFGRKASFFEKNRNVIRNEPYDGAFVSILYGRK